MAAALAVESTKRASHGSEFTVKSTVTGVGTTEAFASYASLGFHGYTDHVVATMSGTTPAYLAVDVTVSGIWIKANTAPTSPGRVYLDLKGR